MAMGSFHIPLFQLVIFSFTVSTLALTAGAAPHLSNETDRQALLAFKSQIYDDPRKAALDSWNDSLHFCHWKGIICGRRHHQRVVGMNLSFLHLSGRISPHIGNLSFLATISLSNNGFHGEIPPELGRLPRLASIDFSVNLLEGSIPAALANCSRLQDIQLFQNMLALIPHELGLLSELGRLDLGRNKFTGVFPLFLTNLSSLVGFYLAANSFHGSIPEEVGKLSKLRALCLFDNSFSGELPPTVYYLSNIRLLSIFENRLSGSLSPDIGYFFPYIEFLIVFSNHFTGKIPASLSNCSHLQDIDLSENSFVGSIPTDLGKLQDIVSMYLWGNRLGAGESDDMLFLSSFTNCSKLEVLQVGQNELSGTTLHVPFANFSESLRLLYLNVNFIHGPIPSELGNVPSLQRLSLFGNFLTGHIPSELGKLQNLQELILSQNNLSGQIPPSLGNLSRLVQLLLTENHLHGRIPSSIGNCTNLQNLLLYHNYLGGTIPKQLFNIASLIFLDLSYNSFDGNLPVDIEQLQNLNSFNVSHNKLSGKIPSSLGHCRSVVSLDLSFNSFEGIIPMTLEALSAAEIVDLSSNHLNGSIPSYFTKFGAIQVLNLSFNALKGEVPLKGPFTNASKIYLLGNSELCGGILELHLPACPKLNVERDHHHKNMRPFLLKIVIPCSIGILIVFIATCYLSMSYWRKRSRNVLPTVSSSMKKQNMQITYAELHRATNGFSVANLIGSGSFGSVFKGVSDSYGQMDIAVKVINVVENASGLQGFISECEALKKIRHRNVVKILTSCSSLDFQGNEFRALVFKFMKNGSLDSWLHPNSGLDLYLSFSRRLDVAIDVANALDYLHNQCETPIIHCDLKPSNILLDEDMVVQVTDFGLAKVLLSSDQDNSTSYTSMLKGSIGYIPPEYGERYRVTPEGDVYSYGVLLLEMFLGKRPNHEMFKDGLSISKHAETEHRERLLEIVDPRMMQNENFTNHPLFQACFSSIIEVAISCTSNLPQMRKNMSVVCSELHAARAAYQQLAIHKPKNILLEPAAPSTGFFCNNKNNKTIVRVHAPDTL